VVSYEDPEGSPDGSFDYAIANDRTPTRMKFFKLVAAEMKKVIWPNRNTTALYTLIVIIVSLFVAYYLGLFDFIFAEYGLRTLIR